MTGARAGGLLRAAAKPLVPKRLGREAATSSSEATTNAEDGGADAKDIRLTGWDGRSFGDRGLGAGRVGRWDRYRI